MWVQPYRADGRGGSEGGEGGHGAWEGPSLGRVLPLACWSAFECVVADLRGSPRRIRQAGAGDSPRQPVAAWSASRALPESLRPSGQTDAAIRGVMVGAASLLSDTERKPVFRRSDVLELCLSVFDRRFM